MDALGSVRATLDDAGTPIAAASDDAWGVPETAAIAPFGFTGELQQGSDVWLRVRWYGVGRGGFGARDAWAGVAETPYSLMYYPYGYSNPVLWTDASGYDPGNPPQPINNPCTPFTFDNPNNSNPCQYPTPTPSPTPTPMPPTGVTPTPRPTYGPTPPPPKVQGYPLDIGIVLGIAGSCGLGIGANAGVDLVLDFYDFEANAFGYVNGPIAVGVSATLSIGLVWGWSTYQKRTVDNYKGLFGNLGVAVGPVSVQGGASQMGTDGGQLKTGSLGGGVTLGGRINGSALGQALQRMKAIGIGEVGYAITTDDLHLPSTKQVFHHPNKAPTMQDANAFSSLLTKTLLPLGPPMIPLVVELNALLYYNAGEWQKRTDYMQR